MAVPRLVCLIPALALLSACSLFGGADESWEERALAGAPPRRDLLGYCERGVAQAGYPAPEADDARGEVVSAWRTELQPFGGKGRRYRAIVQVLPSAGDGVLLRARVETQANEELARPMDPAQAEWKELADDPMRARVVLQHVLALLETSGVGGAAR
jgi:hypothetical protein